MKLKRKTCHKKSTRDKRNALVNLRKFFVLFTLFITIFALSIPVSASTSSYADTKGIVSLDTDPGTEIPTPTPTLSDTPTETPVEPTTTFTDVPSTQTPIISETPESPTASSTDMPESPTLTETLTPDEATPTITNTPTAENTDSAPNQYYVSVTGSDENPGTENQPWLTIQKAADMAAAGDTVTVLAGNYALQRVSVTSSGNNDDPIIYRAEGNVILHGGFNIAADYITIKGFEIAGSGSSSGGSTSDAVILVQGSHNLIEQNYIHDANWIGISAEASSSSNNQNNTIKNNIILTYRCVDISDSQNVVIVNNTCINDQSIPDSYTPVGISLANSADAVIENNLLFDMQGDSIQLMDAVSQSASTGKNLEYRSDGKPLIANDEYYDLARRSADLWDVDPQLVDPLNGNYQLSDSSPAIDAGITRSSVTDDFDGNPRPKNNGYDIGAYEFQSSPQPPATNTPTPVPPSPTLTNTADNPTATLTDEPVTPTATETKTPESIDVNVDTTTLPAPNLRAPLNRGVVLTTRPTFQWDAVPNATSYTFQLSTSATFSSLTASVKVTTSNYTVTSDLVRSKTYYWRVMAKGSTSSPWSQVFSFTSANPPTTPSLASPANGSLLTNYQPRLDWHGVDAEKYQVQVASKSSFIADSIILTVDVNSGTHYDFTTPLPANGNYYWHVKAFDARGQYSLWSPYRYFKTAMLPPVLLDPVANGHALTTRPTFNWADVSGATGYTIQISKSSTFSSSIVKKTVTSSLYTPTSDLPRKTLLYWRVNATGSRPSLWSQVFSFTSADPPPVPSLLNPANNMLLTSPLSSEVQPASYSSTQNWTNVTGADHYQLRVATNQSFLPDNIITDLNTPDSSHTITTGLIPNTTYYWQVRSFDAVGQYSTWATARSFRTPMTPPVLLNPADNGQALTTRPTLDWEDVSGATGYKVQVSTISTFSSTLISLTVTASTYTLTSDLPRNSILYWRVVAKGTNQSDWSPVFSFTSADPPSSPVLSSPASNSVVTVYTPRLDWNDVLAADHYQVQVSTSSSFTAATLLYDRSVGSSEFSIPSALAASKTYYWRARSLAADGQYSLWSAYRSFRTSSLPSTATVTRTPAPPTATKTNTLTATKTNTPTATKTKTPTATKTNTLTATKTYTPTGTKTNTLTATKTNTPTATKTKTPTATKTNTPTATKTYTPSATKTNTPTATKTNTPGPHTSTNYYVSTTGSDSNPGSISQPWKTIQKGIDAMVGGDTVYIRGGTYNQPVKFYIKTNTTGQYMTLMAYPGEEVIVDGTGITTSPVDYNQEGLIYIKRTDYVRISGLKIQHSNAAGVYIGYSDHVQIDNNQTYDTVKSGISAWGATNVVIDGNDIALACNSHPNYPMSEENISMDNVAHFEIKNNYVHKASNIPYGASGGEGINIKDGSSFGKIHNNVVHLDERPDGAVSNRLAFGLDAWNNANGTHDIEYYNNVAYNNHVGFIISSEQGGPVENIKVYNNIAYNNTTAGFAVVWWSGTKDALKKNIQFFNNVSYHNGIGFQNTSPKNENVVIRNNIFSQNTKSVQLLSGSESQFTIDHNLFYGSGGSYGSNTVIADPKFVNPAGANFQLQSDSPAIDAGSSTNAPVTDFVGNSRPRGAGFDIGAYEY